jgi:hypothetical protein
VRRGIAVVVAGACAACSLFTSFEGVSDGEDAGGADASGDIAVEAPAEARGAPCPSGMSKPPVQAFELTEPGGNGVTCDVQSILANDNFPAGLDLPQVAMPGVLDGKAVGGCIGLRFESGTFATLALKIDSKGAACGHNCVSDQCDNDTRAVVFAGPSRAELVYLETLTIGPVAGYEPRSVGVPQNANATYVAICRDALNSLGRDIIIDAVEGSCR